MIDFLQMTGLLVAMTMNRAAIPREAINNLAWTMGINLDFWGLAIHEQYVGVSSECQKPVLVIVAYPSVNVSHVLCSGALFRVLYFGLV